MVVASWSETEKVSVFPQFEELSIRHGSLLRNFAAGFQPYSEFSFSNLFAWCTDGVTRVCRFENGLALLLPDHETKRGFYTLIGTHDMDLAASELIKMSCAQGLGRYLRLVPQTVVDSLSARPEFIIKEDRDNFDYILSAKYHAELIGSKNEKRRYLIRKFLQENGSRLVVKRMDLADEVDRAEILHCMAQWVSTRSKDPIKGDLERTAITRVLDSAMDLPVQAIGFYVDGLICAFSIFEYLNSSTGIVHFEKCDVHYKGLAPYVRNRIANVFLANHVLYINYEQDLGLQGLRQAKSMLHPVGFLKKYTVGLKS